MKSKACGKQVQACVASVQVCAGMWQALGRRTVALYCEEGQFYDEGLEKKKKKKRGNILRVEKVQ